MNSKVLSAICFKVLAIYLFVSIIISLSLLWGTYYGVAGLMSFNEVSIFYPIVLCVFMAVLGGGIVGGLLKASNSIMNDLPDDDLVPALSLKNGYKLLGLFFFICGLSYLPNAIIQSWDIKAEARFFFYYVQWLAEPLILIIAGVILNRDDVKKMYKKLQGAGL